MTPMLLALCVIAGATTLLWLVSLALRDASIVDMYWGFGFVLVAAAVGVATHASSPRAWLAWGLVTLWGLRLTVHLVRRNAGHGEDYRYVEMRAKAGGAFWLTSLFTVFWLQGAIQWVVVWTVVFAIAHGGALGVVDVLGCVAFGVGLYFEAVGDAQLAAFKRDPANRGRVCDVGLWRYTRHPNYFGDAMVWCGLWLVACGAPRGWMTVVSPAVMTFLLTRVSGVALLEKKLAETRPGFAEYVRRTSGFIPRPPRD